MVKNKEKNAARMWAKKSLPLLKALKSFKGGEERTALLGYLNDEACESIYHMIANILRNENLPANSRKKVVNALSPHKKQLRYLTGGKSKSKSAQRKKNIFKRNILIKMGGGVLSTLLNVGIPLLLTLLNKK